MRALILCGGLGTRLGLKHKPKCMAVVNGQPILEHIVNHLYSHGISEIIVNLHVHPEKVMEYFGTKLLYFYEPKPLGRDETIIKLRGWLGESFIVMNGDTITNIDITAMRSMGPCRFIGKYGRFGGTEVIRFGSHQTDYKPNLWNPKVYYFDCGTPQKLAKARRILCKKL